MPPKVIYLIPDGSGEYSWCDDPAPGSDCNESESVRYIRADLLDEELLNGLKQCEQKN